MSGVSERAQSEASFKVIEYGPFNLSFMKIHLLLSNRKIKEGLKLYNKEKNY